MKIKFDSDDKLPLNKQLKFLSVTVVIRSVFEEDDKYYAQAFLSDLMQKGMNFNDFAIVSIKEKGYRIHF